MAGQWYARSCGVSPPVDPALAQSSLQAILKHNVRHFAHLSDTERKRLIHPGHKNVELRSIGAVNGMRVGANNKGGTVDNTCLQGGHYNSVLCCTMRVHESHRLRYGSARSWRRVMSSVTLRHTVCSLALLLLVLHVRQDFYAIKFML
eukprot:1951-Heterococcus_DN1.PRE.2